MEEELVNVELMLVCETTVGDAEQLALRTYAALSPERLGMELPETAIVDITVEATVEGESDLIPLDELHTENGPASK